MRNTMFKSNGEYIRVNNAFSGRITLQILAEIPFIQKRGYRLYRVVLYEEKLRELGIIN